MQHRRAELIRALAWGLFLSVVPTVAFASDEYIAGYASAVLQHEFGVTNATVQIRDGNVVVTTRPLGNIDRGKLEKALKDIRGVRQVEIREGDPADTSPIQGTVESRLPEPGSKWLPRGLLFTPLHGDPRWPQFAIAYRHFTQGLNLTQSFAANFGETFSLYRNKALFGGDEWELSIQAGVFSLFDIDSKSIDLVNADYRVGFLGSYRKGAVSGFLRIQHQSSHLGDEFLLNNPQVTRVNLSYEEVDLKLSYDLFAWLRLYGGGGYIVHRFPDNLGRGTTEWGIELISSTSFVGGRIRPVAYADFQCNERTNWDIGRSLMAGVQFENARIGDRQIQLLAEYYAGPSPDGQFYAQRVGWYGVGLHLYF